MIIETSAGRKYRLWFNHSTYVSDRRRPDRRATHAVIQPVVSDAPRDQATDAVLAGVRIGGVALCSSSDNFSRAKGREIALGRALAAMREIGADDDANAIFLAYEGRARKRQTLPLVDVTDVSNRFDVSPTPADVFVF